MFNLFSKVKKDKRGFSLVELLVVLLIMSIIASVAIPLYLNQQKRSSLSLAQSDTTSTGQEINSLVGDYTNFGTATGTITFPGGVATFSPMTGATGNGAALSTGPGTTTSIVRLSPNSTASGSYGTGASTPWCIVVANRGTYAQYTNTGLAASQIGGTAPTCVNGLAVAGSSGGSGPYTYTWTQQGGLPAVANWYAIASSSDGVKLVIAGGGYIYTSTNSGVTWIQKLSLGATYFGSVTSSSDGTHLAAAIFSGRGDIWTSSDSGTTWVDRYGGVLGTQNIRNWQAIASSSDGSHLVVASAGWNIAMSADGGATWTLPTSGSGGFGYNALASSSDGSHLVAISGGLAPWTSTDYGVTWTYRSSNGNNKNWNSVTSSSDGTHLATAVYSGNGDVWTSANSGVTWVDQTGSGSRAWFAITSSSDGTHLVAGTDNGNMYTSSDTGVTWVAQTGSGAGVGYWYGLASSSDGKLIAAANWGGTVSTGVGS